MREDEWRLRRMCSATNSTLSTLMGSITKGKSGASQCCTSGMIWCEASFSLWPVMEPFYWEESPEVIISTWCHSVRLILLCYISNLQDCTSTNHTWTTSLDKKKKSMVMHHVTSKNLQSAFAVMHRCVKSRQVQVAFACDSKFRSWIKHCDSSISRACKQYWCYPSAAWFFFFFLVQGSSFFKFRSELVCMGKGDAKNMNSPVTVEIIPTPILPCVTDKKGRTDSGIRRKNRRCRWKVSNTSTSHRAGGSLSGNWSVFRYSATKQNITLSQFQTVKEMLVRKQR